MEQQWTHRVREVFPPDCGGGEWERVVRAGEVAHLLLYTLSSWGCFVSYLLSCSSSTSLNRSLIGQGLKLPHKGGYS